jgi:hypothetical protein
MIFTPSSAFGLPNQSLAFSKDCWAIDKTSQASGGSDNGFLDCARNHTPGFSSHGSTGEAVANLIHCFADSSGIANIVGHGNDGFIVTGQGQEPVDPSKYIATWNQLDWGPQLQNLRGKANIIKLWGCHPGTGQEGSDLLYSMMSLTNATCMGPTGFLFCGQNGFSLEGNSTWQVSSPGQPKPAPIAAPTPHLVERGREQALYAEKRRIPFETIIAVRVLRRKIPILNLQNEAAREFLSLIDFSTPITIESVIGALVTGAVTILFDDNGRASEIEFTMYNNRILQAQADERLHYRCTEAFRTALLSGL